MLTIIKASLLGSALMLLASCTGYLTNYQTPCVEGHVFLGRRTGLRLHTLPSWAPSMSMKRPPIIAA